MSKIYRVQMNSKGMPDFSTAVEIEDIPIYGNEHNCMMTIFGECSYAETGCGDCAVVEKVRKALSVDRPQEDYNRGYCDAVQGIADEMVKQSKCIVQDRPQGKWIRDRYWSRGVGMGEDYGFFYRCSLCEYEVEGGYTRCGFNFCPYCGADMRGEKDETD